GLVDPYRHRRPELLTRPARLRAPAPRPRRQAAEDPVRHPGLHRASDVRALHERTARGVVPPLRGAPVARGVRLRGQPGARAAAPAQEARAPLTALPLVELPLRAG